jgi:single-strand DNA-binding protein
MAINSLDNQVRLTGNLTRDLELRYTKNGKSFVRGMLAVNRGFGKDDKGADFLPVVMWGKTAEAAASHTVKGQQISVLGRLRGSFFETGGEEGKGKTRLDVEVVADQVQFGRKPNGQPAEAAAGRGKR